MRQSTRKPTRRRIGAVLSVALAVMVVVAGNGLAATSVKPYVEPVVLEPKKRDVPRSAAEPQVRKSA